MIFRVLLVLFLATLSVQAEEKKDALISRIAHDVVAGVMPLDVSVSASQAPDQRVLDIAERLADEMPISEVVIQARLAAAQQQVLDGNGFLDRVQSVFFMGLGICLVFYFFYYLMQKVRKSRGDGRDTRVVTVRGHLKTAPYLLAIPLVSMDAAGQLGRALVRDRLIARADVVPQRLLSDAGEKDGVLMLVQTVKGRLKKVQDYLPGASLAGSVVSVPIMKGFGPHLDWIADMADGRG